ncbi:hypothetical protein D9V37_16300 [Nocardioides mangrovicus]|uniref:Uncharacterized protein n=1 Tax=Nocardioides mangrovicus TaxID=2478913 RepID=A0A3L8NZI5_9ACTN|nr:hypothetical protein [Nocardioides mangrovicus]RLV47709.1 hypothetical protein D9V37_16300 [Nocardioides mangrovicus]
MSDMVNASPQDIRKLAGALAAYRDEVTKASKKVQGALAQANWHDSRKQQFEGKYRDLQKKIDSFMSSDVDQMAKGLKQLASKLEDIRNVRM